MRIKHFYYNFLYFLHTRALGKIYGGKSTIKVKKVKEHLLNKDKIDIQLTGESQSDDPGQVHFSREKNGYEGSSTGNLRHKSLKCNYCHKMGHIRADCWLRKKKQPDANVTELIGEDEEQCDILSVTNKSVGNKDKWIIDSGCSQHISFNLKMFS